VFRGRHFQDELIVVCVRRYLRYSLSYRDLEELMAERGSASGSFDARPLGLALCSDPQPTNAAPSPQHESFLAAG
jgi:hypothetical protein